MDAQNFVAAQALKDATMAYFILKNHGPKKLFIHHNGDCHSKGRGGIGGYLKQFAPDVSIRTIYAVSRDTPVFDDECKGLADIVLVFPGSPGETLLLTRGEKPESQGAVPLTVR